MLSEFAGAAQSLGAGAILVNPWNITDLAAAIEHSLTMRYRFLRTFPRHARGSVVFLLFCERQEQQHRDCNPVSLQGPPKPLRGVSKPHRPPSSARILGVRRVE